MTVEVKRLVAAVAAGLALWYATIIVQPAEPILTGAIEADIGGED